MHLKYIFNIGKQLARGRPVCRSIDYVGKRMIGNLGNLSAVRASPSRRYRPPGAGLITVPRGDKASSVHSLPWSSPTLCARFGVAVCGAAAGEVAPTFTLGNRWRSKGKMLSVEQVELETRRRRSARLTVDGSSACFCAELSFFEVTVSARGEGPL